MRLYDAGTMIHRWYLELETKFPDIQCDAFVCMPNHVHFIMVNVGADLRVRPENSTASRKNEQACGVGRTQGQTHRSAPTGMRGSAGNVLGEHVGSPLHRVVQWFKTMATNEYIRGVKQHGWPHFPGKLWQRNYWEHIIRDESELNRIREYIGNNPAQWEMDQLYISPNCPGQTNARSVNIHETRAGYATEEWMV
ncbi:transposase [Desulfonatronum thioautotrophicum]|uniref:transposase n=1 Tax=Desulfonatronum thioautotrophicum TaxID=617001 RepID=UPI001ABFA286|nr:transposase [Desulfonatronum thioautotrophicum]